MTKKIAIVGAGGCGINSVNRIIESYTHETMDVYTVDTSESNIVSEAITESYTVGDGLGSGKDRAKNIDGLVAAVPRLAKEEADVTIIIASSAGGSGNVIANLIAATLLRSGQRIVFVMVCHTNTLKNAENTRKAFKSLDSICDGKYQIPCFIYDNKDGRAAVDKALVADMTLLLQLLCLDYAELDDADKLRFLTPNVIGPNSVGIYAEISKKSKEDMSAGENQLIIPSDAIIPSVITINKTGDSVDDFVSMEDAVGVDSKFKCIGISGIPISPAYLKYLGEKLEQLKRMHVHQTKMSLLDEAAESVSDKVEI